MKTLPNLFTPKEVDEHLDEMFRHSPIGYREMVEKKFEDKSWTAEDRQRYPKVNAALEAFERRAELTEEIRTGRRTPAGEVHVFV